MEDKLKSNLSDMHYNITLNFSVIDNKLKTNKSNFKKIFLKMNGEIESVRNPNISQVEAQINEKLKE